MAGINLVPLLRGEGLSDAGSVDLATEDLEGGGEEKTGINSLLARFGISDNDDSMRFGVVDYVKLAIVVGIVMAYFNIQKAYEDKVQAMVAEKQERITKLSTEIKATKTKIDSYQTYIKDAENYDKQKADLRRKLDMFNTTVKNRDFLVKIVDFAVLNMPRSIWLDEMKADLSTKEFTLKGNGMSLADVADYMKKLEGAVFYPTWELKETAESQARSATNSRSLSVTDKKKTRSVDGSKRFELTAKVVDQ